MSLLLSFSQMPRAQLRVMAMLQVLFFYNSDIIALNKFPPSVALEAGTSVQSICYQSPNRLELSLFAEIIPSPILWHVG
jgi:hypothetical protein